MIGKILVITTAVFSLISVILYLLGYLKGKNSVSNSNESTSINFITYGNFTYNLVIVGVLGISLYLLSNIVVYNF